MIKGKKGSIISKLILAVGLGYVVFTMVSQQITLNKYDQEYAYYENKKLEENIRNADLLQEKENINTDEYIEKVARDKLGLVMPNETIYVDSSRY